MAALESYVERKGVAEAEADGWIARKLAWINRRGAPDRFFAKGGRIVLVEFKRPGGVVELHQQREHARLRGAGVEVHVVDTVSGLMVILRGDPLI